MNRWTRLLRNSVNGILIFGCIAVWLFGEGWIGAVISDVAFLVGIIINTRFCNNLIKEDTKRIEDELNEYF